MIKSRNLTSHIYDEKVANDVVKIIIEIYFPRFQKLYIKFCTLQKDQGVS